MRICSVENCDKKHMSKNLCEMHYYRMKRHGSLNLLIKVKPVCSVAECKKLSNAKGLCHKHYMKIRNSGTLQYKNLHDGKAAERDRARTAQWKRDNWSTYKNYLLARKSRVKKLTPAWANLNEIQSFYRACPTGHHVDHVVPINGREVTGLHVIENLQYLPAIDNLKKGRKLLDVGASTV